MPGIVTFASICFGQAWWRGGIFQKAFSEGIVADDFL